VANEADLFSKLLQSAHLVNESELQEAMTCAKRLEIPLERALTMLKVATEERLQPAVRAKEMVAAGRISLDEASKVLQHASQHGISFEEAMPGGEEKQDPDDHTIHLSTTKPIHPLAEYLLAAKLVNPDQLSQAVMKADSMHLPLGKALVVNRYMTRWAFGEVLTAACLVKEKTLSKEEAFKLLKDAILHHISLVQLLFEAGKFENASGDTLTLPELLIMAECLSEADYQDILEHELLEKKTYLHVITENHIMEGGLLQSALSLQEMIGSYLRPFQAAEALKQVAHKKIPVYQAIAELKPPPQVPLPQLRLGDLLVEAGMIARDSVESIISKQNPNSTLVRIGKKLLEARLIDDTNLYNALRCQSAYREGVISANQAVGVLSCAHDEKLRLEDAFAKCHVFAPVRMQWNWH
jgi:hypothetical protein